jgi:type I restriction enzyme, S subunit
VANRDGWKRVKFGDIAENVAVRVDDPSEAGVDRYVGLEHLDPGSLAITRWGSPTDVEATKLRFSPGDIIFGRRRAYQRKLAFAEFEGICSAHAMVLRAKPDLALPEFLPFFLQSDLFFSRALAISVGSLSPTINWKTLKEEEFELPPMDEQREIAEVLWAGEKAVRAYRRVAHCAQIARHQLFASLTADAQPGELGDALVRIEAGKSPSAAGRPAHADELGVLKVSAVGDGAFVESENKALLNTSDFVAAFEVRGGDILVTRANASVDGVGRPCRVASVRDGLMLSDKTLRLVPDLDRVDVSFLLAAMRGTTYRSYIRSAASGTEAKNISQAKLRRAPLPLPPLGRQREIAAVMREFDTLQSSCQGELDALRALQRAYWTKCA